MKSPMARARNVSVGFCRLSIGAVLALTTAEFLFAGQIEVKSKHDQSTAYIVVYPDAKSSSDAELAPGIYTPSANAEKIETVIAGTVLGANRFKPGILKLFEITQLTNRNDAMAIVDGRIRLFSTKTRGHQEGSMLTLGEEGFTIESLISDRKVELPPITDMDQVRLVVSPMGQDAQGRNVEAVLLSIKVPNPLGKGFTLAFQLRAPTRSDPVSKIDVSSGPWLIDHDFYEVDQLRKLILSADTILAPNKLDLFAKSTKGEDPVLSHWKEKIRKARALMARATISADEMKEFTNLAQQIPYYRFSVGDDVIHQFPLEVLARAGDVLIAQFIQPVPPGQAALLFSEEAIQSSPNFRRHFAQGKVDVDSEGKYIIFSPRTPNQNALMFSIFGRLHLIYTSRKTNTANAVYHIIDTGLPTPSVKKLEFSLEGTTGQDPTLFITAAEPTKSWTRALKIEEVGMAARPAQWIPLLTRAMDLRELEKRIVHNNGQVLFDNISSSEALAKSSSKEKTKTTPLVDLGRSTSDSVIQVYLTPQKEINITNGVDYREYNPQGARISQTGLYVALPSLPQQSGIKREKFVSGKILLRQGIGTKKPALLQGKFDAPSKFHPSADVTLVAVEPEDKKDATKKFKLVVVVTPRDGQIKTPTVVEIPVNAPFKHFIGAELIQGRRQLSDQMNLLLFFKADGSLKGFKGGVLSLSFDLDMGVINIEKGPTVQLKQGGWIEKQEISASALRSRIVVDARGQWHWIINPGADHTARFFGVKPLSDPSKALYPNSGVTTVSLRFNEPYDSGWDSVTRHYSDWYVFGEHGLTRFRPDVSKFIVEENARRDRGASQKSQLFTGLPQFLDTEANDQSPNRHQVLLVEPELKERFSHLVLGSLILNKEGRWSLKSTIADDASELMFYYLDPTGGRKTVAKELRKIAGYSKKGARKVVYVDLGQVLKFEEQNQGADKDDEKGKKVFEDEDAISEEDLEEVDPISGQTLKNSTLSLVAKEGQGISNRDFNSGKGLAKRMNMIVVATPDEWRLAQEKNQKEAEAGIFKSFEVNTQFLTSSWTLWPPKSEYAQKEIRQLNKAPVSVDEQSIFPRLQKVLAEAADPKQPCDHQVIILQDELLELVQKMVLSRWATDQRAIREGLWSYHNQGLNLFMVGGDKDELDAVLNSKPASSDSKKKKKDGDDETAADASLEDEGEEGQLFRDRSTITQDDVVDNYAAMHSANDRRRSVLIGDMDTILKIGRPVPDKDDAAGFVLRDAALAKKDAISLETSAPDQDTPLNSTVRSALPHLLYLIATEGQMLQPKEFKDVSKRDDQRRVPTLIFGTQRQWNQLMSETTFEQRFGLEKHFKFTYLEVPTADTKVDLVRKLLDRPNIRNLEYTFVHRDLPSEEAKEQLIQLLVNRAAVLARQFKIDVTTGFLRTYTAFARALTEDVQWRTTRVIDQQTIESLFARVFPIPLNPKILPASDWIHKIQNVSAAALALQQMGYDSPPEPRERLIETVLLQTRGAGNGRSIPSSFAMLGPTSVGKSFLFEKFLELTGLNQKEYDPARPNNEEAQVYRIPVGAILETKDPSNPQALSIDEVMAHITNLLALPQGHRAVLFFDDLHKAKTPVILKRLIAFLDSLFEAKDGMLRVKRLNSDEVREIPIRNLTLGIALNPANDEAIRKRFVKNGEIISELVAAIAQAGHNLDPSFFARISTIINLQGFSATAKVPTLGREIRKAESNNFLADPSITLISPEFMTRLVEEFPSAHARDFLPSATGAILDRETADAPLFIVGQKRVSPSDVRERDHWGSGATDDARIKEWIRKNRTLIPVTRDSIEGRIRSMDLLARGFRFQVYQAMLLAAQKDPKMIGTHENRLNLFAPFLVSMRDHLEAHPAIPVSEMLVRPSDFRGLNEDQQAQVFAQIEGEKPAQDYFPFEFSGRSGTQGVSLDGFLGKPSASSVNRTRQHVMSETAHSIQLELQGLLAAYFRLDDIAQPPATEDWFEALTLDDPKEAFGTAGGKLVNRFSRFVEALYDDQLNERVDPAGIRPLGVYDLVRLYLFSIDKALSLLPWAKAESFTLDVLETARNNLALGHREGFSHFLFKSGLSPFNALTSDSITQRIETYEAFTNFQGPELANFKSRFQLNCRGFVRIVPSQTGGGRP